MKRRIFTKDKEAVSPVIATILMVAITVVLAATLYMMIDTEGDDATLMSGSLSITSSRVTDGYIGVRVSEMRNPSAVDWQDVRITLLDGDIELASFDEGNMTTTAPEEEAYEGVYWTRLIDGRVRADSTFRVYYPLEGEENYRGMTVELRVDGQSISRTVS